MKLPNKKIKAVCGDLNNKWCNPKSPNNKVNHHIPDCVNCGFFQKSIRVCDTAGNSQTILTIQELSLKAEKLAVLYSK